MNINKKIERSRALSRRKYALSIEDAFLIEENRDKRVSIPEFRIRLTNLDYLFIASQRKKITRSRFLEEMILFVLLYSLLKKQLPTKIKNKRRYKIGRKERYRVVPKFTIHPALIEIVRRMKAQKQVSFTVLFDEMFFIYRRYHPNY